LKIVRRRPWLSALVLTSLVLGGATLHSASTSAQIVPEPLAIPKAQGDITILTYNVKGLPWPVAWGRPAMLDAIGKRLARLRSQNRQPTVVVLQEAFTEDARRIADAAGYPYVVLGPGSEGTPGLPDGAWYRGETQGPQLDGGLMLLSDFPVESVQRAAFPADACAGFDCLAAKGAMLVTVSVPGKGQVAIANTHFNSRGAAKAPAASTARAYARQAEFLAGFIKQNWDGDIPLVIAGDFNRGQRPYRMQVLPAALTPLQGGAQLKEALTECLEAKTVLNLHQADAQHIADRARDMQLVFVSARTRLEPVGATVPFGSRDAGGGLSDHLGFIIDYRLEPIQRTSHADHSAT